MPRSAKPKLIVHDDGSAAARWYLPRLEMVGIVDEVRLNSDGPFRITYGTAEYPLEYRVTEFDPTGFDGVGLILVVAIREAELQRNQRAGLPIVESIPDQMELNPPLIEEDQVWIEELDFDQVHALAETMALATSGAQYSAT